MRITQHARDSAYRIDATGLDAGAILAKLESHRPVADNEAIILARLGAQVVVQDRQGSNGDTLVAIARQGQAVSIMLVRSDGLHLRHLRVDTIREVLQ